MLRITLIILASGIIYLNLTAQPSQEDINQARNYFNSGVEYGLNEKYDKALEAFNNAIEINSIYTKAFLYRGLTKTELAYYEEAIRDFTITIELDPGYSDQAHYFRGIAKHEKGNYNGAIQDFTVAIRLSPDFISFFKRGKSYLKLEEHGRALQDFDISSRLNPDYEEVHLYRGITLYYLEQYQSAVQDLDIATQVMTDNPEAFYYAGLAKIELQNSYAAIEELDKCISLDPNYHKAYQARAKAKENIGNREAAQKDIEKADIIAAKIPEQQEEHQTMISKKQTPEALDISRFFSGNRHSADKKPKQLIEIDDENAIKEEAKETAKPAEKEKTETFTETDHEKIVTDISNLSSGFYNKALQAKEPKGFGVQIASYTNTDNIQNLANAYEEQFNNPVYINVAYVNDRKIYRIIIGKFNKRSEAELLRNKLRENDFPDSFLVVFDRFY